MSQTRQLAAIMFTDIVGYTALMGRDEARAFEVLRKNRDNHKMLIKQFQGTWIKELGDGVLSSFQTVTNAVFCAAALHEACRGNADLILRIGIHVGEVIFENNDVFGDGVNIASRLQALAAPGSTWVSEPVYKNLINKKEITSEFIKEELLKNVSEPVKVYEITVKEIPGYLPSTIKAYQAPFKVKNTLNKHSVYWILGLLLVGAVIVYFTLLNVPAKQISLRTSKEKSIAILPFKNMSEDKENQHFADGMMDEILNKISQIKEFRVISRTSVEQYRGTNKKLNEIAKELGVLYLLEGNAQKYEEQIKVTLKLTQTGTDQHLLWSKDYVRPYKQIFTLQTEIANSVASELQIKLTAEEQVLINKAAAANSEAYDLYLRGKEYIRKFWDDEDQRTLANARKLFQMAITIDSQFAKAWSGLAIEYYHRGRNNAEILADNYLDSVYYYCNNALKYDPQLVEAHWMIGRYYHNRLNSEEAIINFQRATEIDPKHINSNWNLAKIYHTDRDYVKTIYYFKKLLFLLNGGAELPTALVEGAEPYISLGNFELSDSLIEKGLKLRPDMLSGHRLKVWSLTVQGKLDQALEFAKKMYEIDPNSVTTLRTLYNSYAYLKDFKNAYKYYEMFEQLEKTDDTGLNNDLRIAYILWNTGKKKEAQHVFLQQIATSKDAIKQGRWPGNFHYDLAAAYAFQGDTKNALLHLESYMQQGFNDGLEYFILIDPLFENLRSNKEFKEIVEKAQAKKAEISKQIRELELNGQL